jgi:hypothetical protein
MEDITKHRLEQILLLIIIVIVVVLLNKFYNII